MAVNKNFVVKNGLEVGDTLIFATVTDAKVGIGSTQPTILLDVAGGIGATHINVSGVATITDSIRLGSGIAGTVFSALDNNLVGVGTSQPGFLLDVRSPGAGTTALYVQGDGKFTGDLNVNIGVFALNSNVTGFSTFNDIEVNSDIYDIGGQTGTNQQVLVSRGGSGAGVTWADLTTIPAGDATLLDGLDSTQFLRSDVADTKAGDTTFSNNAIFSSNVDIAGITTVASDFVAEAGATISGGNLVVGNSLDVNGDGHDIAGTIALDNVTVSGITTVTGAIDGNGGANISGAETVLSSATVSDLTNNRVVIAGSSGALEDDADFTFDGSTLTVNNADVDITGTGGLSIEGSTVIDSSGVWQGSSAGIQGIQGITGSNGSNGTQGIQGITGSGTQGIQGITGSNGSNGTQGIQGIQGITGSNGSSGTQGVQGIQGAGGLTTTDADTLDTLNSTQFLRSDAADQKTSGTLRFDDNVILSLGTGDDAEFFCDGTDFYLDLNSEIGNFIVRDGTTTRFTFDDAGDFTATGNVTAYSDITLKKNIEVIPNALDKVSQIRGVTFDRIDIEGESQTGVIAQEIEKVLPEAVRTNDDGVKSVAYGNLVGLLVESIKELKQEISELKSKVEE